MPQTAVLGAKKPPTGDSSSLGTELGSIYPMSRAKQGPSSSKVPGYGLDSPRFRFNKYLGFPCSSVGKESACSATRVQSLGWEDPLEKEMATHSSTLPGKSHGQRSLMGCKPWGCKESGTTEWLTLKLHLGQGLPHSFPLPTAATCSTLPVPAENNAGYPRDSETPATSASALDYICV